ncbi:hypothetical protein DPMN_102762 [Dreissena polymorpha]|uniref:Uncharacterized protein n=1 Tax=Dreissena polymorpha TaxID=45954 RepID=A0A9D4LL42_DREPO|nr:hypothetical protein DPMN_102762 [Dreissena polymorpha]
METGDTRFAPLLVVYGYTRSRTTLNIEVYRRVIHALRHFSWFYCYIRSRTTLNTELWRRVIHAFLVVYGYTRSQTTLDIEV